METRGPESNSSELLCLSWLPATLMMIWLKMNQKQPRKGEDIIFPIISQWGISGAMETRVLIQSAPKRYAAFPPSWWCYT